MFKGNLDVYWDSIIYVRFFRDRCYQLEGGSFVEVPIVLNIAERGSLQEDISSIEDARGPLLVEIAWLCIPIS